MMACLNLKDGLKSKPNNTKQFAPCRCRTLVPRAAVCGREAKVDMNYTEIVNSDLKNEFVNDLFETYEVEVIYDYDRSNEGIADKYRAAIPEMGLEFLFDEQQKLVALFMDQIEHMGHNPFEGEDPRYSALDSPSKTILYAEENSIEYEHREVQQDSILGEIPEWVKLHYEKHSIHYSFQEHGLDRVTIQSKNA